MYISLSSAVAMRHRLDGTRTKLWQVIALVSRETQVVCAGKDFTQRKYPQICINQFAALSAYCPSCPRYPVLITAPRDFGVIFPADLRALVRFVDK